jgi:hypothetical protein
MDNNNKVHYLIVSLIIGIIFGCFLFNIWYPIKIKGPDSRDIIKKVYYVDGKLYRFNPVVYELVQKK